MINSLFLSKLYLTMLIYIAIHIFSYWENDNMILDLNILTNDKCVRYS